MLDYNLKYNELINPSITILYNPQSSDATINYLKSDLKKKLEKKFENINVNYQEKSDILPEQVNFNAYFWIW